MKEITPDSTTIEVALRLEYLLREPIGWTTGRDGSPELLIRRCAGVRLCQIVEEHLAAKAMPQVVASPAVPKGTALFLPKLNGTIKDGAIHLDPIPISTVGSIVNIGDAA